MDELEKKYLAEIVDLLSSVNLKILELLKKESRETFIKEEIITKEKIQKEEDIILPINYALPKTGTFQWYSMSNEEGKIRRCENRGCDLFLKYNKELSTYEHWKIDANSGKAFFVNKHCQGEM